MLKNSVKVWKLARDLGITPSVDDVGDIIGYCNRRIRQFLKEFGECDTLDGLLECAAAKVGTFFIEIDSDQTLAKVAREYVQRGERMFANLERELAGEVYGVTFRLQKRENWESRFVSIIDCRGPKAFKSYFTKWHEVAHLLVLTDQSRLTFARTHESGSRDPEEALMDVIASRFGYYAPIIRRHANGRISFTAIESIRSRLCPDASRQSAVLGMVEAWPTASVLIRAEMAVKRGELENPNQSAFGFRLGASQALRAVRTTANEAARKAGIYVYPNMRVPESSVIHEVFAGSLSDGQQSENLSSWTTSQGRRLAACPIVVEARLAGDAVEALITPLGL